MRAVGKKSQPGWRNGVLSFSTTTVIALMSLVGVQAQAGTARGGTVVNYSLHGDESIGNTTPRRFAFAVTNRTEAPSCASTQRFVVDLTTPTGRSIAATIMLAKETGGVLDVIGTGTCNLHLDSEDVDFVTRL